MGVPLFKIRSKIEKHSIEVYSSNYVLYGDMSAKVMATLSHFSFDVEIYSIDEAFVDLSWLSGEKLRKYAIAIRATVMMWTGIPISIGIAPTKTLAKVCNRVAKKQSQHCGVFIYPHLEAEREAVLKAIAVEDIWGIGRQYDTWLRNEIINNALLLRDTPEWMIQKKMGIVGVRLLRELNGISCLDLELQPKPKKRQDPASPTERVETALFKSLVPHPLARECLPRQATCISRSFRHPVKSLEQISEAIATHTTQRIRADRRLRRLATLPRRVQQQS